MGNKHMGSYSSPNIPIRNIDDLKKQMVEVKKMASMAPMKK